VRRQRATAAGLLDWKVSVAVFLLLVYLGLNSAEAGLYRLSERVGERPGVMSVSRVPSGGVRISLFGQERIVGRSVEIGLTREGGPVAAWSEWRQAALRWLRRAVSWIAGEVRRAIQYRRGIR
jgi:hypothetical protein